MKRFLSKISHVFLILLVFLWIHSSLVIAEIKSVAVNHLPLPKVETGYSFLVGGHLYGSPFSHSFFPAPSLLQNIDRINQSGASFFVSLGDNYRLITGVYPSNFFKSFVSQLKIPFLNVIGNHDISGNLPVQELKKQYQSFFGKIYYHFSCRKDAYIILDTEFTDQLGDQLQYFKGVIESLEKDSSIENVFLFSHKVIWLDGLGREDIFPSIYHHLDYKNKTHLGKVIAEFIKKLAVHKNIYWIAEHDDFLFFKNPDFNITYLATGIKETEKDHLLQVQVSENGGVVFKVISLTGAPTRIINNSNLDLMEIKYRRKYFPTFWERLSTLSSRKVFRTCMQNAVILFLLILGCVVLKSKLSLRGITK